jgi:hypothetical protein
MVDEVLSDPNVYVHETLFRILELRTRYCLTFYGKLLQT